MVNLSERMLCGIRCAPWLVFVTAGEDRPGNAGKLVGERDRQRLVPSEAGERLRRVAGEEDPSTVYGSKKSWWQRLFS